MKKLLFVSVLGLGLGACNLFGSGSAAPAPTPKPGPSLGKFMPGPAVDPETGKTCNPPGGLCLDDHACHSDAEHCHAK